MSVEKLNTVPELKYERMAHIVRELSKQYFNSLERRLLPYGVNHGFWGYLRELYLTEYGKSLKDTLEPLAKEVNDVAQSGMSPEEIAIVRKYLLNMHSNLVKDNT